MHTSVAFVKNHTKKITKIAEKWTSKRRFVVSMKLEKRFPFCVPIIMMYCLGNFPILTKINFVSLQTQRHSLTI